MYHYSNIVIRVECYIYYVHGHGGESSHKNKRSSNPPEDDNEHQAINTSVLPSIVGWKILSSSLVETLPRKWRAILTWMMTR
eukprot:scaffold14330_cov132-Skeletonema_marinoi.AAC.2